MLEHFIGEHFSRKKSTKRYFFGKVSRKQLSEQYFFAKGARVGNNREGNLYSSIPNSELEKRFFFKYLKISKILKNINAGTESRK